MMFADMLEFCFYARVFAVKEFHKKFFFRIFFRLTSGIRD